MTDKMEEQKKDVIMQEEQDKKQGTEKKKKKKPDTVTLICMVVGVLLIVFALSQLIPVLYHYVTEENAYEDMREEYVSVDDAKKKNGETEADKNWWYENISVDLEALQKENKEAVAWIRFDSMDLSYPVMYSGDNENICTVIWTEKTARREAFLSMKRIHRIFQTGIPLSMDII